MPPSVPAPQVASKPASQPASQPLSSNVSSTASNATGPAGGDERRQHTRIAFHTPAQLLVGNETSAVVVLDISLKGALITVPAGTTLTAGADCELRVELDQTGGQIRMDARLAHVGDDRAGLVCRLIDIDSVTHLRRLVELNLGDPALLERELSALIAE